MSAVCRLVRLTKLRRQHIRSRDQSWQPGLRRMGEISLTEATGGQRIEFGDEGGDVVARGRGEHGIQRRHGDTSLRAKNSDVRAWPVCSCFTRRLCELP